MKFLKRLWESHVFRNADLVTVLTGGLGNRLHCLYSMHNLTLRHGLRVRYFWRNEDACGCKFDDIFDPSTVEVLESFNPVARRKIESQTIACSDLRGRAYIQCPWEPKLAGHPVAPDFRRAFRGLKLQRDIVERIDHVAIPENTLGIHVRGGDIKAGLNGVRDRRRYASPNEFFPVIDKALAEDSDLRLFLSCEDEEDEPPFLERYGGSIITGPCSVHGRNTVEGIKSGFVNIVLLSKCRKIVGINSSYSGVAVKIAALEVQRTLIAM